MIKVLFVCMGNICRSPLSEGAFAQAIDAAGCVADFAIDSAGTIGYHAGSAPDPRAQQAAKAVGIDIARQKSRKVTANDFAAFDYIVAMDNDNYQDLMEICPPALQDKISLFLPYGTLGLTEMSDPYYGSEDGFGHCMQAAQDAATGLLNHINQSKLTS